MNNEIVQRGLFGIEQTTNEPDEIVIDATWASLSETEFDQAATDFHKQLDQQENVRKMMTNEVIRKKGELYMAYKSKMGHGKFYRWLEAINVSPTKAQDYMMIVEKLGEELSNPPHGGDLAFRQWREIARSPEQKQIIAKINSGEIEATSKAINAELEAAKQRAKAEKEARERAEEDANRAKAKAQSAQIAQSQLEQEISTLKSKLETMARPQEKIIYEDTPETRNTLANLKKKQDDLLNELRRKEKNLEEIKVHNAKFAEENRKLTERMRQNLEQEEAIKERLRVQNQWRRATDKCYSNITQFISEIPSPIDQESLDGDDWARQAQCIEILQRALTALQQMRNNQSDPFVEATIIDASTNW